VLLTARSHYFGSQFDRDLQSRAKVIAAALAAQAPSGGALDTTLRAVGAAQGERASIVQVRSEHGLLASSVPGVELPVLEASGATRFETIDGDQVGLPGTTLRMVSVPATWRDERVWVQEVASLDAVNRSQAALRSLLMLLLPVMFLGTGLAAWYLSGHALRRIHEVAEALRHVKMGGATTRVEVADSADEIGEMVGEMNAMLGRLESAFRSQERFIVNVTHELKTPVAIMLAQAQLLKGSPDSVPKGHREFVLSVEEEMRRLGALLESFLTLARAGQGHRIESSLVSLHEVVIEAIRRVSPEASAKRMSLVPLLEEGDGQQDCTVRGDEDLLTTALTNLIRDAVEHAPPGSPVEVAIASVDSQLRLEVRHRPERDIGGSAISHARPGRRRTRELGLEIARGIAQLHGGDVWAEESGGANRAVMRLPAAAPVTAE
jgi:two-component system OmpR family sensor kinase